RLVQVTQPEASVTWVAPSGASSTGLIVNDQPARAGSPSFMPLALRSPYLQALSFPRGRVLVVVVVLLLGLLVVGGVVLVVVVTASQTTSSATKAHPAPNVAADRCDSLAPPSLRRARGPLLGLQPDVPYWMG